MAYRKFRSNPSTPLGAGQGSAEHSVQFWALPFKEDVDQLARVQKKAARMSRGPANMTYEERSEELGLFSLKERSLGLEACKSSNMWKVTGEKGADWCVCTAGGAGGATRRQQERSHGTWKDAEGADSTCMERELQYWPLKIPFRPFLLFTWCHSNSLYFWSNFSGCSHSFQKAYPLSWLCALPKYSSNWRSD